MWYSISWNFVSLPKKNACDAADEKFRKVAINFSIRKTSQFEKVFVCCVYFCSREFKKSWMTSILTKKTVKIIKKNMFYIRLSCVLRLRRDDNKTMMMLMAKAGTWVNLINFLFVKIVWNWNAKMRIHTFL